LTARRILPTGEGWPAQLAAAQRSPENRCSIGQFVRSIEAEALKKKARKKIPFDGEMQKTIRIFFPSKDALSCIEMSQVKLLSVA